MFLRFATPPAAGRSPGLLRRAYRAVQVAVAVTRVVRRRIGSLPPAPVPVRPPAPRRARPTNAVQGARPDFRLRLEPTGHSFDQGEVSASLGGEPVRCRVVLEDRPGGKRRPEPVPATAPADTSAAMSATGHFGGLILMLASAAHAVGRVQVRLLAFRERGLLGPMLPGLIRPPSAPVLSAALRHRSIPAERPSARTLTIVCLDRVLRQQLIGPDPRPHRSHARPRPIPLRPISARPCAASRSRRRNPPPCAWGHARASPRPGRQAAQHLAA
jgi:hypothetical protein